MAKPAETVRSEELTELMGVHMTTVNRWAANEGMPKAARGQYDATACLRWLAAQKTKQSHESPEKLNPMMLTRNQLAEAFGVSVGGIHHMVTVGGMPKAGRGKFHLPTCVAWLVATRSQPAKA